MGRIKPIMTNTEFARRSRFEKEVEDPNGLEKILAAGFLLLLLGLRFYFASRFRIESDETQHLHVVWGWVHGFVPYRDFFDNHTPLFHLLYAPVLALLGERADIVWWMRLSVFPLWALILWLVYKLGSDLHGKRVGMWAAVLAGAHTKTFFYSLEFRADDLWTALWVSTFLLLVGGELTKRRAFWGGVLLGMTFCTSLKTVLLAGSLALSAGCYLALVWKSGRRLDTRLIAGRVGVILSGALLVPALILSYFAIRGALPSMYYCIIQHNLAPDLYSPSKRGLRRYILLLVLAVIVPLAYYLFRDREGNLRRGPILVFFTTAFYFFLLRNYWPMQTHQDYLPFVPMMMLAVSPWIMALGQRLGKVTHVGRTFTILLPVVASVFYLLHYRALADDPGHLPTRLARSLSLVLKLTEPSDYVFDKKGETVYRQRPYYFCFEEITYHRFAKGLLQDDIAEHLVRTRTPLVKRFRMPPKGRAFVDNNYLDIGYDFSVLGKLLQPLPSAGNTFEFQVIVPEKYVFLDRKGIVNGELDGVPVVGPQSMNAGPHRFTSANHSGTLGLVWARAYQRGFLPAAFANEK